MRVTRDRDDAARRAEQLLPLSRGAREDRLAVAVAALSASGRYRRAMALDVLGELAAGSDDVSSHALARVGLHAESAALSSIETDRVRAIFRECGSASGLEALDQLHRGSGAEGESGRAVLRARAVMDGCAPGPRPESGRALIGWLALGVVHACREGRVQEGRALLRELTTFVEAGARIESSLWTAARHAIEFLPERAKALTRALLARDDGEPPPHGYLPLADAWLARGVHEEGRLLLRRAARAREPRARSRLAVQLRTDGWAAASRGDRDAAIALLREAKHLAG